MPMGMLLNLYLARTRRLDLKNQDTIDNTSNKGSKDWMAKALRGLELQSLTLGNLFSLTTLHALGHREKKWNEIYSFLSKIYINMTQDIATVKNQKKKEVRKKE